MKKNILKIILVILLILLLVLTIIKIKYDPKIDIYKSGLPYKHIGLVQEEIVAISNGSKFGYYDTKKDAILTELNYELTDTMKEEIDTSIDELVFKDGLGIIIKDDGYGLINSKGKVIIKPFYESLKVFNKNLILVYCNSKYYFINYKEEKIFGEEINYEIIENINNNLFIVSLDGEKYGLINNKGEYLLDCKYNSITYNNQDKDSYLLKANLNEEIENYVYFNNELNRIGNSSNYEMIIKNDNKIYYKNENNINVIYDIKTKNEIEFSGEYEMVFPTDFNIHLVIDNNMKVGYINETGELTIPFEYDYDKTTAFNKEGYAIVQKGDLLGVINTKNEDILPIKYKEINILENNKYLVTEKNGNKNIIDNKTNNLTNNKYTNISLANSNKYLIVENNSSLYGVIDNEGKLIIETKYKEIKIYDDYFKLKKDNNKYIIKKI